MAPAIPSPTAGAGLGRWTLAREGDLRSYVGRASIGRGRRMPKTQRHSEFVKAICVYLRTRGWWVLPIRTTGIRKPAGGFIRAIKPGTWDVLAVKPYASGCFTCVLWLEAKISPDKLNDKQI